jgi:hypothetical protein
MKHEEKRHWSDRVNAHADTVIMLTVFFLLGMIAGAYAIV